MKVTRKIIEIDEDKCTGCGDCILSCQEGALALVDGKAKLVGEILCDGLGACLKECPEGALTLVEREADEFDEAAVEGHLAKGHEACGCPGLASENLACGCPGEQAAELKVAAGGSEVAADAGEESRLSHWPIKLALLKPDAPFLRGKDVLLLADCAAAAFPSLHRRLLAGRAVAMTCPKFEDLEQHISKLTEMVQKAKPRSLTVVHMEVPCCGGIVYAAREALKRSGVDLPVRRMKIGRGGIVLEEENSGGIDSSRLASGL